ncbi:MAG: hypothetical protein E5Y16_02750 [Mesorhizobium sp.]|nr:MAG: hypothetical protein EOQ33_14350 [Mesorhizobium sp.]RWO18118.1 MAG: hypothetical protein EOS08_25605 [Mesorhizobium sp.]RWQ47927.1 MAG: hypothetical protein EOS83_26645 [Mesorhizobium sp.]TJV46646.1 MAG: hypothetical protein E5Y16_02750 [Mesorhizobium sp.]
MRSPASFVEVGAAPHRPAGPFSPYSDGEKGPAAALAAFLATMEIGEIVDAGAPLPVTRGCRQAGEGQRKRFQ